MNEIETLLEIIEKLTCNGGEPQVEQPIESESEPLILLIRSPRQQRWNEAHGSGHHDFLDGEFKIWRRNMEWNEHTGYLATACLAAGLYLIIMLPAGLAVSTSTSTSASVSIDEFLSLTLANAPIDFGNLAAGNSSIAALDLEVTIGAETNIADARIQVNGNQSAFDGPGSLALANMTWKTSGNFTSYTTSPVDTCSGLGANDQCNITNQLNIPIATTAGTYSVGILVTGTNN